jgi:prefoldin subunit 5
MGFGRQAAPDLQNEQQALKCQVEALESQLSSIKQRLGEMEAVNGDS